MTDLTSINSSRTGTASETRNIIDHYHYWNHEAILADLDSRANNFSIICSNLYNDFNIATCIRNANAFLAKRVFIYGSKQYDRRGTVGTHHYVRSVHCGTLDRLVQGLDTLAEEVGPLHIVAVDNIKNARRIDSYAWPKEKHVVMVLGQEQVGVPEELLAMAQDCVYIAQYGSVRSLNVGTASGVVMYDYCAKVL
jgi:tRNA G18 (ribose-2'-O)-methylase SpoU